MNNKLKKALAMFTSFSLGAAMITSIPYVMAEGEEVELASTGRTMSVEFMGRGATPQDVSPGSAKLQSSDVANMTNSGEFWIGLAVDKVDDLALFTDGVYSLEVGFEYDPDFVTPYTDTTYTTWQSALEAGNLQNPVSDATAWWDSNDYEIVAHDNVDLYSDPDREDVSEVSTRQTEGWRMCTACVTLKASAAGARRFTGLASSDKQYVLKLPFKLKRVPTEAEDQNPRVISLVRGPETLDIGSGSEGTDPMAMWVAYDEGTATAAEKSDQKNMKNLFTYGGDISLFGQGGSITDIVIDKYVAPSPTPTEEPEQYQIYEEKALTTAGFKEETTTYYASVPNETEKITLTITSSESPTVQANGASVTTTAGAGGTYVTAEFALDELDKLKEADGFNNTVTVTAGSNTYTIYIRRLLKPKIVLKPGNSPYGMIERMSKKYIGDTNGWDDETIITAKEQFNLNNQFANGYVPDEAKDMHITGTKRIKYRVECWGGETSPDLNMDRNTEALFIYNGKGFRDPGYSVINVFGEEVTNPIVNCSIKVKRMLSSGTKGCVNVSDPDAADAETTLSLMKYTNVTDGQLFTDITSESNGIKRVCPGIYDLEYTCEDNGVTIKATRKIVVLFKTGDTDMDKIISPIDLNAVKSAVATNKYAIDGASSLINNLYLHRIMDTDNSGDISPIDINSIKSSVATNEEIPLYYNELPSE